VSEMKSLLTTAALLAGVVASGCDATCTIISETPDPGSIEPSTQSIAVTFTLDQKEVTSMEVVHLLHDGREIARSSQYSMKLSSNETSQSMVIRWSGKHKKNPSLTMTGTLRFGENKSIHYTEALYNQAKLDHVTVAQCKMKEENAPLPESSDTPPICLKPDGTSESCELRGKSD
jgi:hypothetical protein